MLVRAILAVARPSMRFVAFILFIVAVIALVADLTPFMDHGDTPSFATVAQHWKGISPRSFSALEVSLNETAGPWAWQALELLVFNLPTFFVFGVLGLLAAHIGRHRKILNVYVN